tara:strand:+ start:152 stop:298 length:147 start_codon:yes stop_codon:yes gene_type:complete
MLKNLYEGEPFPEDFWNYNINPILGYRYKPEPRDYEKEYQKYGIEPIK